MNIAHFYMQIHHFQNQKCNNEYIFFLLEEQSLSKLLWYLLELYHINIFLGKYNHLLLECKLYLHFLLQEGSLSNHFLFLKLLHRNKKESPYKVVKPLGLLLHKNELLGLLQIKHILNRHLLLWCQHLHINILNCLILGRKNKFFLLQGL